MLAKWSVHILSKIKKRMGIARIPSCINCQLEDCQVVLRVKLSGVGS